MRPVIRYQSQLLYRKSYKPNWKFKPGPRVKLVTLRPSRAGPRLKLA
jgi:hypothetical protein